jgi:hypothetical protein
MVDISAPSTEISIMSRNMSPEIVCIGNCCGMIEEAIWTEIIKASPFRNMFFNKSEAKTAVLPEPFSMRIE